MNQCDGCRRRMPARKTEFGGTLHYDPDGPPWDIISCTADRYEKAMDNIEAPIVHRQESIGGEGHIILEIRLFYSSRELTKNDERAIRKHADGLLNDLHVETCLTDPKRQAEKHEWIREARECFKKADFDAIFVEEIPNEYCGPACCPHYPWLIVTTRFGHFKVGWRKRVIVLDWSKTIFTTDAKSLFAATESDVTMDGSDGGRMIHCWGYDKLAEYLMRIRAS